MAQNEGDWEEFLYISTFAVLERRRSSAGDYDAVAMANAWREAEQSWDVRNTLWTPRKRNQIEWLINFYDDTRKIDIYSKQKKKKKGKNGARVMELPCIQLLRRGDSQQKNVQVFTQLRGRMRTDLMVATSRRAGTRINSISVLLWLMPSHPLAGGLSGCHVTHIHRKDSSQLPLFFARLLGMTFFFFCLLSRSVYSVPICPLLLVVLK